MDNLIIEYINGQESHSSFWGKFFLKGIEGIKEEHPCNCIDNHHRYQYYYYRTQNKAELFSIFIQEGNKFGTHRYEFYICATDASYTEIQGENRNQGFARGNFKVIAEGVGKTKAPRLMQWWNEHPHSQEFAERCAIAIKKRGVKSPLLF